MSQRESGYARIECDNYTTPEWVTRALLPHLPAPPLHIWEPAAGSGQMVQALISGGYTVTGSDITEGQDFLACPLGAMRRHCLEPALCAGAGIH